MSSMSRRRLMERKIVEHLVSGKGFNEICRILGVGRRRVATLREQARVHGSLMPLPSLLITKPFFQILWRVGA